MSDDQAPPFEQWAIVDCFGHQKLAGKVTEQIIAGAGMIRIDVPRKDGTFITKLRSPKAVYGIDPCSEEIARAVASQLYGIEPMRPMDYTSPQLSGRAEPYNFDEERG